MTEQKRVNPHLAHLVLSHEAAAMQALGKIAGPDGKVSRNLELARFAIDTLEALEEKTRGNLTADEKRMLDHILYQLRLNYVDEAKAAAESAPSTSADQGADQPAATAGSKPSTEEKNGETASSTDEK